MLGLSHMSWLQPKRGLFRPRRHYWSTITLPGFQFFDFAFLGSSVSGILVAPALVWATHSHSQAAMASMHALGRLASTPLNCASLSAGLRKAGPSPTEQRSLGRSAARMRGPRPVQWRWNLTGFFLHRLLQVQRPLYSTRSLSRVCLHPPIVPTVSASVPFRSLLAPVDNSDLFP